LKRLTCDSHHAINTGEEILPAARQGAMGSKNPVFRPPTRELTPAITMKHGSFEAERLSSRRLTGLAARLWLCCIEVISFYGGYPDADGARFMSQRAGKHQMPPFRHRCARELLSAGKDVFFT